jgi:glycerol-3-phosphate dehydrogenase (NAD(P)+)
MTELAVLGAGAWGTALAGHLARSGDPVRLWSWQREHAERMARERENVKFFGGFPLEPSIAPLSDLPTALASAAAVLVAVPTLAVRATLENAKAALAPGTLLVLASKGIETDSSMLLTEVVGDVLGTDAAARAVVLSGPSFAEEVARGLPTNLVAASEDAGAALEAQRLISGDRLRVYTSHDPIGVQVGGALKNVIAIAAGASDGLGFGHNTRAALITRGLAEMARLTTAKGGQSITLAGLAGLGDLVLTTGADLSRNRRVGLELGRGRALDEALAGLGHVAEGVSTAASAYHLAQRLGVDLPITSEVYRVLYEGKPVAAAVSELLQRTPGKEWT